jgi:hypothetical protein
MPGEGAADSRHVSITPQGRDGHARRVLAQRHGIGVFVGVVIPLDADHPRHMIRVLYSAQIVEQPKWELVEIPVIPKVEESPDCSVFKPSGLNNAFPDGHVPVQRSPPVVERKEGREIPSWLTNVGGA